MKKTNCTVNGKSMYRIRTRIGSDLDGKPIYKNFYGEGKKEAETKRDSYVVLHSNNDIDEKSTLGQLAKHYTYQILLNEDLAPGTIELYERQYRNLFAVSDLSIIPAADVTKPMMQAYINGLPDNLSDSAKSNLIKYLKKFYIWLENEGYCANVMLGISTKKSERKKFEKISVFTEDEVKKIVSGDSTNRLYVAFVLALATGLREGELLGLKYSDLSKDNVIVNKQVNSHYKIEQDGYRSFTTEVKSTKTDTSRRTVPLPPNVQGLLAEQKLKHKEEMTQNNYRTDYVFTTTTGTLIDKGNFRRAWNRFLRSAGVAQRKFHSCRATYCTMLCKKGIPLETASKLMGHSNINVTAKYYRFVGSDEMQKAAESINSMFG